MVLAGQTICEYAHLYLINKISDLRHNLGPKNEPYQFTFDGFWNVFYAGLR